VRSWTTHKHPPFLAVLPPPASRRLRGRRFPPFFAAQAHAINVIDIAPVYGFGRSEEVVGKAIAEGRLRSRVLIATKA
jgi:aryl-alcohol dehydrogenase-like predicted oxidoreductase